MWVLKGDESRLVALLYLKNILADQAQACTPAIGLRSIDNLKDLTHACFSRLVPAAHSKPCALIFFQTA